MKKTRRNFHKATAALAAGALFGTATESHAQQPAATVADALLEIVRTRYGQFLDEDQLRSVRRSIASRLASAEQLRRVPLKNSDEPAFAFSADV
jgi:hypothetical protein